MHFIPVFAYPTTATNAKGQVTKSTYNSCDGSLANIQGPNTDTNDTTTYAYDSMGRITDVLYPPTSAQYGLAQGGTIYCYTDTGGSTCPLTSAPYSIYTSTLASPDPTVVNIQTLDGLGRPIKSILQSGPAGPVIVDTTYDPLGRIGSVSNPYRTSSDFTGITSYAYDALGRMTLQCQPDNGNNTPCQPGSSYLQWSYSGNVVTYYDELRNSWQRTSNALEQLSDVTEMGTLKTHYSYDVLGNLWSVVQTGVSGETPRTRSFTYDSLSRLTCASNPENSSAQCPSTATAILPSGVVSFSYDANGNLKIKSDARGITTNYNYDALNRLTQKSYSNGDPTAQFYYDVLQWPGQPACNAGWVSQCNVVGRLSYEQTVDPTTGAIQTFDSFSYDALGRLWLKWQRTSPYCGGACYSTLYRYDLAGRIMQYRRGTYGDGTGTDLFLGDNIFTYNAVGQIQSLAESAAPNDTPTTLLFTANQYGPMGLTQATLGNGTSLNIGYNKRGWKNAIGYTLSNNSPAYSLGLGFYPNGNVQTANYSINGNWSYSYDSLNRLATASQPGQSFQYGYDSFGNRKSQTVITGSGPQPTYTFNNKNQLDPSTSVTYDPAGDVTWDGFHIYSYDAEGRLSSVDGSISYIYNAEGQRTAVLSGGAVVRQYLYDNVGRPATVIDGSGKLIRSEIWAGEMHIGDYTPDGANNYTNNYIFSDHLGNLRAVYDSAQNQLETRQSLPFGEEQNATGTDVDPLHFTGKERDSESGLDYFGARYYSSTMGRWMSPDWSSNPSPIPFGNIYHPQSLNLYSYVGNRPLTGFDPYGHLDCSGGVTQDVACAVTAAAKSVWHWLSSGSNSSSAPPGAETAAPDPQFSVTSRILTGVSNFNHNFAPNYSGVGVSSGTGFGAGNGAATGAGTDFNIYNDGNGNMFMKSLTAGYTGMHYTQPGGVAAQTHDDDTVFMLPGIGYEAHASFGRTSNPFGTSSSSVTTLNLGIVYSSWSHSEGWSDYSFSVGIGARGEGLTSMHMQTSAAPAHPFDP